MPNENSPIDWRVTPEGLALRKKLKGAIPTAAGPREVPGLFVFDCCVQTLETVPNLPRDDKDIDDVDTRGRRPPW